MSLGRVAHAIPRTICQRASWRLETGKSLRCRTFAPGTHEVCGSVNSTNRPGESTLSSVMCASIRATYQRGHIRIPPPDPRRMGSHRNTIQLLDPNDRDVAAVKCQTDHMRQRSLVDNITSINFSAPCDAYCQLGAAKRNPI